MLTIKKETNEGSVLFSLEGRLDTTTAPELDQAVKEALDGTKEMVFDFEKLEYISSAGLRVLLVAQKAMNVQGSMKVVNTNEMVMEIFEVTGFSDILTIE